MYEKIRTRVSTQARRSRARARTCTSVCPWSAVARSRSGRCPLPLGEREEAARR